MFIRVGRGAVALEDVDNFRAFAVVAEEDADLRGELAGVGVVDEAGEHVFFEAGVIKELAGERASGEWVEGFTRMVEFARSKGWVDEVGRVRAHVERKGAAEG